jgi:hypothetical protein
MEVETCWEGAVSERLVLMEQTEAGLSGTLFLIACVFRGRLVTGEWGGQGWPPGE